MLEDKKEKLEILAETVKEESEEFGLRINEAKTNVMSLNGSGNVKLAGVEIESVGKFKYLGSMIQMDDPSSCEIKVRLAVAKGVGSDLQPIWRDTKLSLELKKRIARRVWSHMDARAGR